MSSSELRESCAKLLRWLSNTKKDNAEGKKIKLLRRSVSLIKRNTYITLPTLFTIINKNNLLTDTFYNKRSNKPLTDSYSRKQ